MPRLDNFYSYYRFPSIGGRLVFTLLGESVGCAKADKGYDAAAQRSITVLVARLVVTRKQRVVFTFSSSSLRALSIAEKATTLIVHTSEAVHTHTQNDCECQC